MAKKKEKSVILTIVARLTGFPDQSHPPIFLSCNQINGKDSNLISSKLSRFPWLFSNYFSEQS